MKASDVKKGNVIEHNNAVYQVRDIEKSSAQGRGGNVTYRFTIYSVANGNKVDLTMRAMITSILCIPTLYATFVKQNLYRILCKV